MNSLHGTLTLVGAATTEDAARNRRAWERAHQMGQLKQVPVSVAQLLLRAGQNAINATNVVARAASLPDQSPRDNVYWKLQWHADALKGQGDRTNAIYAPGADLKNWVLQAFAEWDAAVEGAEVMTKAWGVLWDEIAEALKKLPADLAQAAGDVAKKAAWYAKTTYWVAIGAGVIGLTAISIGIAQGVKHRIGGAK